MKAAQIETKAEKVYNKALQCLVDSETPFLIGGAYAMRTYADIHRETKDLDVFCKAGDYPRLLQMLADAGFTAESTDARWLAKAFKGEHYIDLIFNSANGLSPVDDTWFERAPDMELLGLTVKLSPPEEVLWSKMLVQDRQRFDGADVCHILRKSAGRIDWSHLMTRMEPVWEVLLANLITFQFVYPSERKAVPDWVMRELMARAEQQLAIPESVEPICRGRLFSRYDYEIDFHEWGYRER